MLLRERTRKPCGHENYYDRIRILILEVNESCANISFALTFPKTNTKAAKLNISIDVIHCVFISCCGDALSGHISNIKMMRIIVKNATTNSLSPLHVIVMFFSFVSHT